MIFLMRKSFPSKTISFSSWFVFVPFFSITFILVAVTEIFSSNVVSATGPTCDNFKGATYKVSNNRGSSNFNYEKRVETTLSLQTNSAGDTQYPADIVLVLDKSGSMSKDKKSETAKVTLERIVDKVARSGNSGLRIAFVSFDTTATLNQDFTTDYNKIKVAINNANGSDSGTSLGAGLMSAGIVIATTETHNPNAERFIIFASDGQQNATPSISDGFDVIDSDVMIYTIGIGNDADDNTMTTIATQGGAKNGLYFKSNAGDSTLIFQKVANQITGYFLLQNLSLQFTGGSTANTMFIGADPAYDSYNAISGIAKWNNLGNITNDRKKDITLSYNATKVGTDIPLNASTVQVGYTIKGLYCTDIVPVNVLSLVIFDNPDSGCSDYVWTDEPDNRVRCNTLSFGQMSNCGNYQKVQGSIQCAQCSDYIDNDHDGKIDYPSDPGCVNAQDNSEKDYNFQTVEF